MDPGIPWVSSKARGYGIPMAPRREKRIPDMLHVIWSKLTPCHCFGCMLHYVTIVFCLRV